MARLEAQSKLLYYPTPDGVVDTIATWFTQAGTVRLADPCCGTGTALQRFAQATGGQAETWGVELSYARSAQAKQVLDVVLPASFYHVTWAPKTISLGFNNPPYDWSDITGPDGKRIRHEQLFITQLTPRIVPGGHQVILIPRSQLADETTARHLAGWYEQRLVYRFPNEEYSAFKQVVIFATGKRSAYVHPGKEAIQALTSLADETLDIPVLPAGCGELEIPPAPPAGKFAYVPLNPEDLRRAIVQMDLGRSPEWRRATHVRPPGTPFSPAMPLKIGHLTMLIAGQEAGTLRLTHPQTGQKLLLKGQSEKAVLQDTEARYDQDGDLSHFEVVEKEVHRSVLTIVHQDGRTEHVDSVSGVGALITQYGEQIAEKVMGRNQPLYDFKPSKPEWSKASRVALGLPALPGRAERGLFEVQKHFAIAAARVMQERRHAIMNAEMGFGVRLESC